MRSLLYKVSLLLLIAAPLASCRSAAAYVTPTDIKAIPVSQSVALETAIDKIEANDPAWVDASGNVLREGILAILRGDKSAWDQLDRFYNGGE